MSLPKENSCESLVAQNVTQVSSLDGATQVSLESATVIKVQVAEISDSVCPTQVGEIKPGETGMTGTIDHTNNSEELGGHLKQDDSTTISASNNVTDTELNANQICKKNRRKMKKKKESENEITDRTEVQSSQSNNTDPDDAFSVPHLNQVFSIWGIAESKEDGECEDSACAALDTQCKQVKDCKVEVNSAGTSELVSQGTFENVQEIENILKFTNVHFLQFQQKLGSHCPADPGKSKSEENRRRMKNLAELRSSKNAESVCPKRIGKVENCLRNDTRVEQAGCSDEAGLRSGSANIRTNKKYALKEGSNVEPIDCASNDLSKSLNELYQLLKIRTTDNLSDVKPKNVKEMPGRSLSLNEHKNIAHEISTNFKSQGKASSECAKLDKIVKKKIKKQEIASESASKTKKVKSKNKKGTTTASNRDVTDHSELSTSTSTPTLKAAEKKQKKKLIKFEEYWTFEAVKVALQKGTVIEGPIRINQRRYTESYVTSPTGGQDILIEGMADRNRALEGDLVAVLLKDPSEWKTKNQSPDKRDCKTKVDTSGEGEREAVAGCSGVERDSSQKSQVTGKVVAILSMQHSRKCVGYLKLMKDSNEKCALFSPRDARIPRMQIPQEKCPKDFWLNPASKENTLYMAKMIKWRSGSFAMGEIVKEIGETADIHVETEALLLDNDLDVSPYAKEIYQKYSSFTLEISEDELKKREDLRKDCIFTIDPLTAKDLDDAVSCKELENGNFEIGVHISDVTYFLEEGSVLDTEVSKRATSVYLVETVHHMLPIELCIICSLLPGEDKFAYSVIWEISKHDATVISQRIVRSVIHSCVKLSYEHAEAMLENPDKEWDPSDFPAIGNGYSLADVSKAVNNLQIVAKKLRGQRFEEGALRIDQTKLYLKLDPSGMPVAVHEYINKESHRLIEEFMLLANMTAAKFVYESYPDIAFLRCHPEPHRWPLEQLQNAMASRGIHLNITSAGALQASLVKYSGSDFLSQTRHVVLNSLSAKTMTRAKYFCSGGVKEEEFWHYALSVPFYTHFTSPIRRYADVMVHRLLNAALNYCSKPSWNEKHVASIAANCNKKKYSAKLAGEQSIKLYLAVYLKNQGQTIEDAVVIDVKDHSFDVVVMKYGLTMRVYISKLKVDLANDPSDKSSPMKIMWQPDVQDPYPTLQVVDIFTLVKVMINCDDSLKLEAVLIRPENSERLSSELGKT